MCQCVVNCMANCVCLFQAARSYGYALVSRSPGKVVISTPSHQLLTYDLLHVLEFDPERKCMSVIVREPWSSRIILYSKGADSTIFSNLAHPSGAPVGRKGGGAEGTTERVKSSDHEEMAECNGIAEKGDREEEESEGVEREEGEEESGEVEREGEGEEVEVEEGRGEDGRSDRGEESEGEEREEGEEEEATRKDLTEQHLTMYAKQGLRTLCMAKRVGECLF